MTNEEQQELNTLEHQRIEATLSRIERTIHGNGKVGLVTVVDRHTQTLGIAKKLFWGILGVVGTIAGGVIIAAIL